MHMHKLTLNAHVALWAWLSTRHCISWKSYKITIGQEQNEYAGNDEIQYFKV